MQPYAKSLACRVHGTSVHFRIRCSCQLLGTVVASVGKTLGQSRAIQHRDGLATRDTRRKNRHLLQLFLPVLRLEMNNCIQLNSINCLRCGLQLDFEFVYSMTDFSWESEVKWKVTLVSNVKSKSCKKSKCMIPLVLFVLVECRQWPAFPLALRCLWTGRRCLCQAPLPVQPNYCFCLSRGQTPRGVRPRDSSVKKRRLLTDQPTLV